jgi:hypothetical protein
MNDNFQTICISATAGIEGETFVLADVIGRPSDIARGIMQLAVEALREYAAELESEAKEIAQKYATAAPVDGG